MVVRGNGQPLHVEGFDARYRLTERGAILLTDPDRQTYQAAGMVRSIWSTLGPRALWGELSPIGKGFQRGPILGDGFQQGGALVLDRDQRVAFAYSSEATADNVATERLFAIVLQRVARHASAAGVA